MQDVTQLLHSIGFGGHTAETVLYSVGHHRIIRMSAGKDRFHLGGDGPQHGGLRVIAAITQGQVIRKILRHLELSADPPLIAPARLCRGTLAWASS